MNLYHTKFVFSFVKTKSLFSFHCNDICENNNYCYILDLIYYAFYHPYLLFYHLSFNQTHIPFPTLNVVFLHCQIAFLNSLPNGKFSNLFIVAAFSNSPCSDKTYSPVKNSYLPTLPY